MKVDLTTCTKRAKQFALIFFLIISCLEAAFAQRTISYQGMLNQLNGTPFRDSSYRLDIYLASDRDGNPIIWSDSYLVETKGGVFSLQLGAGAVALPKPSELDHPLWIATEVNGRGRTAFSPISSSFSALSIADSTVTSSKMATDYVASVQINGQQVTARGGALNFVQGSGVEMRYDSAAQSVIINSTLNAPPTSNSTGSKDWSEAGNYINGEEYLGTSNQEDLVIKTNSNQVMRYIANEGDPNIQGGNQGNFISRSAQGSIIAGGGGDGTDNVNLIGSSYATISGGSGNVAGSAAGQFQTVGGGHANESDGEGCTVAGGIGNHAGDGLDDMWTTVAGGIGNQAEERGSAIAGGDSNHTGTDCAFIGGGSHNEISITGSRSGYEVISGGLHNSVMGISSAIAGGQYLTLGAYSFGFNGGSASSTTPTDLSAAGLHNVAYFGNVNMMLGNTDGEARALQFYSPNTKSYFNPSAAPYYSSFKAGAQLSNIYYTLPTAIPQAGQVLTATSVAHSSVVLDWTTQGKQGAVWSSYGNNETDPLGPTFNYLGTADNHAFEIHVDHNGSAAQGRGRVLRFEPNSVSANLIGGFHGNTLSIKGIVGAGILSGGKVNGINVIGEDFGIIAGGWGNLIDCYHLSTLEKGDGASVIGGGWLNYIGDYRTAPNRGHPRRLRGANVISGGSNNTILTRNAVGGNIIYTGGCSISGGEFNTIASPAAATVGGFNLRADGEAQCVIGTYNFADGNNHKLGTNFQFPASCDKIFVIGNGERDQAGRSNAFSVSYDGHSVVSHVNGSGQKPAQGAIRGATYVDNIVYAWGDIPQKFTMTESVPASYTFVTSDSADDFGVKSVTIKNAAGVISYEIVLNVTDDYCNNTLALDHASGGASSITVTPTEFTSPGDCPVAVPMVSRMKPKDASHSGPWFVVKLYENCQSRPDPFMFKVCGRPTVGS